MEDAVNGTSPDPQSPDGDDTDPPMVVGIGASAGGLKALQQFMEAVPADSGMVFVVILHLDPGRESRMGELLQDRAAIPVTQVDGSTIVEPDHIYIIPPGMDLAMRRTTLDLRERGERAEHAPVDLFFRTLSSAYGSNAAGVVLSGTGSDGTAGIRHIREAGGITIAQSPDEAEFDGMPSSAIATGLIDLVLPAARIPAELLRLRAHASDIGSRDEDSPATEAALAPIFDTLRKRTGHDFSLYKRSTLLRRLDRRLRFNEVTTLEGYHPLLQGSTAECQALLRDLLISVTSYFRDPDAFDALSARLPAIFERKGAADSVRAWVVGCATGEEAYSIAMILTEHADTLEDPPELQVFATDIDEKGYAWARAGLYEAAAVTDVSAGRLKRFFTKEGGGYRIKQSLREMVLFAGHNALHDPPFSRIDLISCRNLFIYLQPAAQLRLLETFHFASNPGGILFLGTSETVGDAGLFVKAGTDAQRVFLRASWPHRVIPRAVSSDPWPNPADRDPDGPEARSDRVDGPFSYGALHLRMLEEYTSPSVIVNERLDVVHMSAGAGRFLRLRDGEPTRSVLGLAGREMHSALRTALYQAFEGSTSTTRRVSTGVDGHRRRIIVRVEPSAEQGSAERRFALVFFEDENEDAERGTLRIVRETDGRPAAEIELEAELSETRQLLEAACVAHDRTVAELQAANEEFRSVNEEQKAATEELETSREEIQSINEELTTINQEHQSTIEELKRTNADLQNLIESTEIGSIFLDREMRIRRFTPTACAVFNFVPEDRGRPISHITHRLNYEELVQDVATVLDSLDRTEREVESDTGESYIVRINPYRSLDGVSEGAVLTLLDNTVQHRINNEMQAAKVAAETANQAKGTFLSTLSHEFRTPLNAILGFAENLDLHGELTAKQVSSVERIKAGGRHLASMIDEILSFAKLDGGQEVVQVEPLDARDIAREAGALVEQAAHAKALAFVLELPDSPVEITTDGGKARLILINLCANAVKFTEAGEVRLSLRAEADRVIFEIRDTGIGIAAEHHAQIFERFWQVGSGSTRAAGGMGIGLAAAREYARLLRGDVELESEPGRGTTFLLWLPVAHDHG